MNLAKTGHKHNMTPHKWKSLLLTRGSGVVLSGHRWVGSLRSWHAAVFAELISLGDLNKKMAIQSEGGNDIYVSPAWF